MTGQWCVGNRIDDIEINQILSGGMGAVYIVYDHLLKGLCAVKTYREEIETANPTLRQRFMSEAKRWINLDLHPNVAHAFAFRYIQQRPYLFMEYVEGGDLSAWIPSGGLREIAVLLGIQFCDGMIHLNTKGIKVHRDIKPQNCLMTPDGILKITDFGLAKLFDDAVLPDATKPIDSSSTLTPIFALSISRTGAGAGTPPYMAPEQFADAKNVDVRADIYSFGVMFFEMFTGALPFLAQSWQDFERLHRTQPPPQLPTQHLELSAVIQKCMAKAPEQRFADFATLRRELAAIVEDATGKRVPQLVTSGKTATGFAKAISLFNFGCPEEALQCLDRALELDPHNARMWIDKGEFLLTLAETAQSLFAEVGYIPTEQDIDRILATSTDDELDEVQANMRERGGQEEFQRSQIEKYREALDCFVEAERLGEKAPQLIAECRQKIGQ